ncbi:MAG: hypothetical protein ACE5JC_09525 [Candidatus Zixiibacteriota bacterium]
MDWSGTPVLLTEDVGDRHRVSALGIMENRLAVSIFYEGSSVDVPWMGPKISVELQSIAGEGTFRVAWRLDDIRARWAQLEVRVGADRTRVHGPIDMAQTQRHVFAPISENSMVFLDAARKSIQFGLNWEDALHQYLGTIVSPGTPSSVEVMFGDFNLDEGDSVLIDPLIEGGGGGGGGGPPPTVSIYNLNVDRNSISGEETTISWSTSPSSSCDTLEWGPTTAYGNTIDLACDTHSATISGLQTHKTYYFKITASKSGYYNGYKSGSWYPTDASLSKAYEGYTKEFWGTSPCGERKVDYSYSAEMPGDLAYDPEKAQGSNNYEVFDMHFHYESQGQQTCWPWHVTTKHTRIEIWIKDHAGVIDWINAKDHVIMSGYTGSTAEVTWGVVVGGSLKGASAGFTASITPGGWTWNKDIPTPCQNLGGGEKYCGWFQVNWPGDELVSGDMIWPMIVTDQLAEPRLWDKVTFKIKWTIWFDTYWFYWYGNDLSVVRYITLGDGNYNGANILDQYTNVQVGFTDGPET